MSSSLNPIVFAMRQPITVMAGVAALCCTSLLALQRMAVDVFPTLDLPVIYISQPYGGMDPSQMETQISNYYEGHSLYINGLHHVESKNIQGIGLVKLFFHPGTNMAQAMAETVGYVNRASGYLPYGTKPPFIVRFDTGSVPVGYLVVDADTPRAMGELSDLLLQRVRPIFGSLPGVSAPPPIGGTMRSIVVNVNPDRLRAYRLSPDDVANALTAGNIVMPSGNVRIQDQLAIVPTNAMVLDPQDLGNIPLRLGENVYLRDIATVSDAADIQTGFAMVNGKRTVYLMVTKTADASTLAVVNAVKANLPKMQDSLPRDVHVRFEFDQSPYVTRAMWGVVSEGVIGALLTGLMVLLFLRDWRSVVVVVLNIPLALMGAVVALWATGQTINIMTLGGMALAIGILVDEATVEVENIHSQLEKTDSVALAVRRGNAETAVPRLLAMLCVLAVFLPMFFMEGAAGNMFKPLALAVGFSMITSYLLSSMFVPVVSVWLIRHAGQPPAHGHGESFLTRVYGSLLGLLVGRRWSVVAAYLAASLGILTVAGSNLGTQIFPTVDTGQFLIRLKAPTGTRIERTEELARQTLTVISDLAGHDAVETTVGFVGTTAPGFSNQAIYLWTSGPEEAVIRVALKHDSGVRVEDLKTKLRQELPTRLGEWLSARERQFGVTPEEAAKRAANIRLSFEPADIINEVMSFGSPTPVEVVVFGPNQADNQAYAAKVNDELKKIPGLVDLQYTQAQDYPSVEVKVDREKAGQSKVTMQDVTRSLVSATSSSRYIVPNYWADMKTGLGYQVQIEIPPPHLDSAQEVGLIPVRGGENGQLLVRDVATIHEGTMPAEYDRLNLRRLVSMTANIEGNDLGRVSREITTALRRAGTPPRGVRVELRGQVAPMEQMFRGLGMGLILAVVAIFLLLTAYFQSPRLALVAVAAVPAVLAGVASLLVVTGTTLNIQSFMGAIMAIGVAVANAILVVTFAERHRREAAPTATGGATAEDTQTAAIEGARHRLRPILMTSCAMLAGMVPMALAFGEGGEQTAPLGRAVIGGLLAATAATLLVLPSVFAIVQSNSSILTPSLDPADPASPHHRAEAAAL